MRPHKRYSQLPFLRHISRLADLCIFPSLFRPSDRLSTVSRMLIENVVVPQPQFKRQIRPHRNKSMKSNVVANRPWHTTQNRNASRQGNPFPPHCAFSASAERRPTQQKREQHAKRRIRHQRQTPQQSINTPIQPPLRFRQLKSSPQNQSRQKRRQRCVPNPFERHHHRAGENRPEPRRPRRHPQSAEPFSSEENRHASRRRKKYVERHARKKCPRRKSPE